MTAPAIALPARRPDLVLRPLGDRGRYVVKDPRTGGFFTLGEQEFFLLSRLDGSADAAAVCAAFREKFGEALSEADLGEFVELARSRDFLVSPGATPPSAARQSLLYWRKTLFDPDQLFGRLAPGLGFVWTRGFLLATGFCILLAALQAWNARGQFVGTFATAWRWETALVVWLTLVAATFCHEFAHGLTCKHHGGEVHEVGFLLMYFMPCFFCNVSDAWLFKERSKRLWVTLAGGYCDLCLWAAAVFAWRLTAGAGLAGYLAWVVMTVVGARVFFNFNPLLKLDGYYLLGDWLEIPNLRQHAWGRLTGWSRWLLWGAARPGPSARGTFLLAYGAASWVFSVAFLALMLAGFWRFLAARWGAAGAAAVVLLGAAAGRGLFQGFSCGEVRAMFLLRRKRAVFWVLVVAGLAGLLVHGRMDERAAGHFEVRPAARAEVRAPVAGFLREVYRDEADHAYAGEAVVLLEVPDLDSRLERQRGAARESAAKLALLRAGARSEEVEEQRARVARSLAWRDRAAADLARARKSLVDEVAALDKETALHRVERTHAQELLEQVRRLSDRQAQSRQEALEAEKLMRVAAARQEQAEARRRARETAGTHEAETELASREKGLAEARAALRLIEAGTRPEEVEAEEARLASAREEVRYLEQVRGKLRVPTPVAGVVSTPRLREKIGQYFREGDLICVVEDAAALEIEVTLDETDAGRVRPGQAVELRCRAFPLGTLPARVVRVAPRANRADLPTTVPSTARGEFPSAVVVHCRLEGGGAGLRPGMTGRARVIFGEGNVGEVLADRFWRYLMSEF